jgi:GT2 family glycosyltransferase
MTAPRLAAIVCSRDRPEQLAVALEALAAVLGADDEAVVVDSASVDASAVAQVAATHGFRVVRCDRPGLSRARNAGVRATVASIVAFTDDDCRVDPGWADAIASAFADDDRLGFVTGSVVADRETRLPLSVGGGGPHRRFGPGDDPLGCGHGATMAFRRTALDGVGGFDEALGAGGPFHAAEDSDMFWRLLSSGWAGAHDPSARATHVQWRSTTAALKVSRGYGIGVGAMVVKGIRSRREDGWRLLGRALWDGGLRRAWRDLRAGYQTGAVSAVVRVGGVLAGAARGARRPLRDDRFE